MIQLTCENGGCATVFALAARLARNFDCYSADGKGTSLPAIAEKTD
jgi:hypothetical protein